jgi:hypothetical protein
VVRKDREMEIVRGNFGQICSYCGDNKERSWGELQEHIRVCPKHPLAAALRQLSEVERERDILKKCNTTGWDPFEAGKSFQRRQTEAEKEAIWQRCEEIAHREGSTDCSACADILIAIRAEKEGTWKPTNTKR